MARGVESEVAVALLKHQGHVTIVACDSVKHRLSIERTSFCVRVRPLEEGVVEFWLFRQHKIIVCAEIWQLSFLDRIFVKTQIENAIFSLFVDRDLGSSDSHSRRTDHQVVHIALE